MNVLVTGGTGFLGQHLAKRLLRLGHTVTVLGRNLHVGQQLEAQGMHFIQADFCDSSKVIEACRKQTMVFHAGALSTPWGKARDFHQANVLGTQNVIQGCQQYGIQRLIHVSSPSIYFDFQDRFNISEDSLLPRKAANLYAHTKQLAESVVDNAFQDGLPVITIRPRAIFGPGDQTILPRLIKANQRMGIPLINGGQALIDITYVDNVVDALIRCVDSPACTLGEKYNISNGSPMSLRTLLESLFQKLGQEMKPIPVAYPIAYSLATLMEGLTQTGLFGREPLFTRYSIGVLAKSQTLDISRARNELGYHPAIDIDEGLERFARWWKEAAHVH